MPQALQKKNTSVEDIKKYFEWFETEFSNVFQTAMEEFWEFP